MEYEYYEKMHTHIQHKIVREKKRERRRERKWAARGGVVGEKITGNCPECHSGVLWISNEHPTPPTTPVIITGETYFLWKENGKLYR